MIDIYEVGLLVSVGLTIGHFLWEAFNLKRWDIAIKRSWYQFMAIAVYSIVLSIR